MKFHFLFGLIIVLFTSCVGTKKFSRFVETKVQEIKKDSISQSDFLILNLSELDTMNSSVVSITEKSLFIPAIVYWQWNKTIKSSIDKRIISNIFQQSFIKYADSFSLSERLNEQKLLLKIERLPNSFRYINRVNVIFLLLAYSTRELEVISPEVQDIVIRYELMQNDTISKRGEIQVPHRTKPMSNEWKSTKKFTWEYLDRFKSDVDLMTKDFVQQLSYELD